VRGFEVWPPLFLTPLFEGGKQGGGEARNASLSCCNPARFFVGALRPTVNNTVCLTTYVSGGFAIDFGWWPVSRARPDRVS